MKRILIFLLLFAITIGLYGCRENGDMPYNGDVSFHEITVTIPQSFIRDSTQSNADLWCFEKGFYSQIIILSRKDITGDVSASLDSYAAYMTEQGCDTSRTTFAQADAVHSTYTQNDQFCQEMLFALNGSFYAVALRGGTVEEFEALLDSIKFPAGL